MRVRILSVFFFIIFVGCSNSNIKDEYFQNTCNEICKIYNASINKDFRVPCILENEFDYSNYNGKVKDIFCHFNNIKNKIEENITEKKTDNNKKIESDYLYSLFDSLENIIKNDFLVLFPENARNLLYYDTIFKTNLDKNRIEFTLNYLSKLQVDLNILQFTFLWHLCKYDNIVFNKNKTPKLYMTKYYNDSLINTYLYFGTNYLENGSNNYLVDTIIFNEIVLNGIPIKANITLEYNIDAPSFYIENCKTGNYILKGYLSLRKENEEEFKIPFNHYFSIK